MEKSLPEQCAIELMEILPFLRGNINAHIHGEADRTRWVSPGQLGLLYLVDKGICTIGDLAARQKSSSPTISRQVDCLVEKGMLQRERKSDDRRVVVLSLTSSGSDVLNCIMGNTQQWIVEKMGILDAEQLQNLLQTFEDLRQVFAPQR